jgi:hypothetical protein
MLDLDALTQQDFLTRDDLILRGLVATAREEPTATIARVYGAAHIYHLEPLIMQFLDCEFVRATWHDCLTIDDIDARQREKK